MNAIDMLEQQHREAEEMLERLAGAADDEQRKLFLGVADALTIHAIIEERHFYPAVRQRTDELRAGSYQEHARMKTLIAALVDVEVGDPNWRKLCDSLRGEVIQHFGREEGELFPIARKVLDGNQLAAIGAQMEVTARELEREGAPHEKAGAEMGRPL